MLSYDQKMFADISDGKLVDVDATGLMEDVHSRKLLILDVIRPEEDPANIKDANLDSPSNGVVAVTNTNAASSAFVSRTVTGQRSVTPIDTSVDHGAIRCRSCTNIFDLE